MTQENAFQLISHLIGTPFVPAVRAYIKELTGYSVKDPDEQEQEDLENVETLIVDLNPMRGIIWFNLNRK
ncbi:hypothetical protein [Pseudomonas sp. IAC-BECa141]|uniref:hypothetical protein n=1 Tax=Pseudomonas sp. IAC-BECa141 TaxID=2793103 RepID=UPI001D08FF98|nr:hypothetical protein [Pseudomonas sp. IAC-BECa141]UDI92812.1 hypothetical protein I5961_27540 [Pseudomonas sp. IAC-BECa141]